MFYLLECRHTSGSDTSENILPEFKSNLDDIQKFMVRSLKKSLTMPLILTKAFADLFSLPGFTTMSSGAEYADSTVPIPQFFP